MVGEDLGKGASPTSNGSEVDPLLNSTNNSMCWKEARSSAGGSLFRGYKVMSGPSFVPFFVTNVFDVLYALVEVQTEFTTVTWTEPS